MFPQENRIKTDLCIHNFVIGLIWQGVDVGGPGARAHDDEQPECEPPPL
jgi:hypothetical protein